MGELGISEVDGAGGRASSGFLSRDVQPDDETPRELLPVYLERYRREDVGEDDVEVRCQEVARKTAGVLHAQSLLSQALWTLPWRGTPRHDQLTDVVYIDYGTAVGGQGKKPRGCALAHRWTPGQHQRRTHPCILPHVMHRSALNRPSNPRDTGIGDRLRLAREFLRRPPMAGCSAAQARNWLRRPDMLEVSLGFQAAHGRIRDAFSRPREACRDVRTARLWEDDPCTPAGGAAVCRLAQPRRVDDATRRRT